MSECSCWVDPKYWFYYYGIPEPGSQCQWDPGCPEHGVDQERCP